MKVLKFGGTSVGSAERMKAVADLINDGSPKIVVLSAMSGTTNQLVQLAETLYQNDNQKANALIDALHDKYKQVVEALYFTDEKKKQALELISTHFDHIRSFTLDLFTIYEERAVLAQGELLSTALFQFFLEEQGIPSVLLPALNFMKIDENEEPDTAYISKNLKLELEKYPETTLFITQGYICRNAFGEVDNLKRGGSDYSA